MEAIKKEEIFDEELCGMVRFEDETVETDGKEKNVTTGKQKTEGRKKSKSNDPIDAEYEPVNESWLCSPAVKAISEFLFFAGIEYVVFYWLQTGQMELSASLPSMIVCALLAGISVGKNCGRRNS